MINGTQLTKEIHFLTHKPHDMVCQKFKYLLGFVLLPFFSFFLQIKNLSQNAKVFMKGSQQRNYSNSYKQSNINFE